MFFYFFPNVSILFPNIDDFHIFAHIYVYIYIYCCFFSSFSLDVPIDLPVALRDAPAGRPPRSARALQVWALGPGALEEGNHLYPAGWKKPVPWQCCNSGLVMCQREIQRFVKRGDD